MKTLTSLIAILALAVSALAVDNVNIVTTVQEVSFSPALETSRAAKPGACYLCNVNAFNNNAATRYLLVFDSSSVPANGAIPQITITLAATSSGHVSFPTPIRFINGVSWAISTTGGVLTLGAADALCTVQTR